MYLGQIVEEGDADEVYERPTHPYTAALLSSIPIPDPTRQARADADPAAGRGCESRWPMERAAAFRAVAPSPWTCAQQVEPEPYRTPRAPPSAVICTRRARDWRGARSRGSTTCPTRPARRHREESGGTPGGAYRIPGQDRQRLARLGAVVATSGHPTAKVRPTCSSSYSTMSDSPSSAVTGPISRHRASTRWPPAVIRLSNFHTTALCSPTRACLLTGRNHHRSGMGRVADLASGYPGYWGRPPRENGFLSEMLQRQRVRHLRRRKVAPEP